MPQPTRSGRASATAHNLLRNATEHYWYLTPQFQTMLLDKIQRQRNDCYDDVRFPIFVLILKKFDECCFVS